MEKAVVCLVGPSAVGKSFYAKLLQDHLNFVQATTVTTRHPRIDDGCHRYVSEEIFEQMIREGTLVQWDEYEGNFYGTIREELEGLEASQYAGMVLDLTPGGCVKIKSIANDAMIVALLPDDVSWLRRRLIERGANSEKEIESRTKNLDNYIEEVKECVQRLKGEIVYCEYDPQSKDKIFGKIVSIINNRNVNKRGY
jgi:guanylate kinase